MKEQEKMLEKHSHSHHNHECEHYIHHHHHECVDQLPKKILTIRALSGLSGDIFLAGLSVMQNLSLGELQELLADLTIEKLSNCVQIKTKFVNHIQGFYADIQLPHEHVHRTCSDILTYIEKTKLTINAKKLAQNCFQLLAKAEAEVHGKKFEDVTFHEVGALDSILDICLSCALFERMQLDKFVCSPLPIADGYVHCAHGIINTPVPAVLKLLNDIPIVPFNGKGETITPTAIALLKTFNAQFGTWPAMVIKNSAIIYGSKVFENVANGAIFALGVNSNCN